MDDHSFEINANEPGLSRVYPQIKNLLRTSRPLFMCCSRIAEIEAEIVFSTGVVYNQVGFWKSVLILKTKFSLQGLHPLKQGIFMRCKGYDKKINYRKARVPNV